MIWVIFPIILLIVFQTFYKMISPNISSSKNMLANIITSPSIIDKLQEQLFAQEKTLTQLYQKNQNDNRDKNKNISIQKQDLPQILDISKTQQIRKRHYILRTVIDQTIQLLLKYYKQNNQEYKNVQKQNKNQQIHQNQIFQRLTFIFTQINQINQSIEETILYLNITPNYSITKGQQGYGNGLSFSQKLEKQNDCSMGEENHNYSQTGGMNSPIKKNSIIYGSALKQDISQRSVNDEESMNQNSIKEQHNQSHFYNGNNSLEQRIESGASGDGSVKMEEENK